MSGIDPNDASFVEDAFWIVVGRAVTPVELRDALRQFDAGARRALLMRLLSSLEFANLRAAWKDGRDLQDRSGHERGLLSLGANDVFVKRAYQCLLGRPADQGGLAHYTCGLASGDSRVS